MKHSKTNLSPEITQQLTNLLEFSPPRALRKSLLEVYLHYIITEHQALPTDFDAIASDFYMLVDFFTRIEEVMGNE